MDIEALRREARRHNLRLEGDELWVYSDAPPVSFEALKNPSLFSVAVASAKDRGHYVRVSVYGDSDCGSVSGFCPQGVEEWLSEEEARELRCRVGLRLLHLVRNQTGVFELFALLEEELKAYRKEKEGE